MNNLSAHAYDVYFEQSDPRWGRLPYGGFNVSWTGCGLVAYTMCVDVVTGASFTPGDVYAMRKEWGLRQEQHDGIFARDAYEEYATMHRTLFGVETAYLEDKSIDSIARTLDSGATIWASSRDTGNPWLGADGTRRQFQFPCGHFACIWKHEDGIFYLKDSEGPAHVCNNVPYTAEQIGAWLAGTFENRYLIRACG